jgi:hypothetical protein
MPKVDINLDWWKGVSFPTGFTELDLTKASWFPRLTPGQVLHTAHGEEYMYGQYLGEFDLAAGMPVSIKTEIIDEDKELYTFFPGSDNYYMGWMMMDVKPNQWCICQRVLPTISSDIIRATDYNDLANKPRINNIILKDNKTAHDLLLPSQEDVDQLQAHLAQYVTDLYELTLEVQQEIEPHVTMLQANVTQLQTDLAATNSQVATIADDLELVEVSISTLQTDVDALEDKVAKLQVPIVFTSDPMVNLEENGWHETPKYPVGTKAYWVTGADDPGIINYVYSASMSIFTFNVGDALGISQYSQIPRLALLLEPKPSDEPSVNWQLIGWSIGQRTTPGVLDYGWVRVF